MVLVGRIVQETDNDYAAHENGEPYLRQCRREKCHAYAVNRENGCYYRYDYFGNAFPYTGI